jgi:hypothetical protein
MVITFELLELQTWSRAQLGVRTVEEGTWCMNKRGICDSMAVPQPGGKPYRRGVSSRDLALTGRRILLSVGFVIVGTAEALHVPETDVPTHAPKRGRRRAGVKVGRGQDGERRACAGPYRARLCLWWRRRRGRGRDDGEGPFRGECHRPRNRQRLRARHRRPLGWSIAGGRDASWVVACERV